jgi:hypothetical protein
VQHGLRAASTGEAREVGLSATGVTKVLNDLSGLPAMEALLLAIRPDRRHKARREHTTRQPIRRITPYSLPARRRCATHGRSSVRGSRGNRFPCYSLFARDPNLDSIRSDPELQSLWRSCEILSLREPTEGK